MVALIMTSLPACESNFSFQPIIRAQICSLTNVKHAFLFFPTKEGSPKYFRSAKLPEHQETVL